MPTRQVISSPFAFAERLTAFGMEGSGKSSLIHNIIKYQEDAHAWIIDLDTSYSHERIMATEYPENEDRTHVFTIPADWDMLQSAFEEIFRKVEKAGGFERGDWLCIDPATATWGMVQAWYSDQVHGVDLSDHLLTLRQQNKDDNKAYAKEVADDMTWPLINKLYQQKFYNQLFRWRSHFILVAEADAIRKDATNQEKDTYGFIGYKPRGQKQLPYIAATNIYLQHPKRDQWNFTTAKDRGRELQEKVPFDDFALEYLVEVAGWDVQLVKG